MSSKGCLVIYTGGTIGSAPQDPGDPDSPKAVVSWERLWEATPELERLRERGCRVDRVAFAEPLDSSCVGPPEWARMARIIAERHDDYEGFVILHGTDTMAYSASMLSFMLRDLGKPVVFTGAQRSALVDVRNDATQNFITAILVASPSFSGIPVIPEVVVCFGGLILRGNRTVKADTSGYRAYSSPNLEPIGEVGDRIVVNERLVRRAPGPERRFHVRTRLERSVLPLFMYPGITAEQVRRQLELPGLRGVVVQSFGTGTVPNDPEIMELFRQARQERGILLANVSQCHRGPVEMGMYESSAALLQSGFVSAGDITVEAAQCKLMVLLGEPDQDPDEVEADFAISLAGEQSISRYLTRLSDRPQVIARTTDGEPGRLRLPRRSLVGQWIPRRIDRALIRLRRCRVKATDGGPMELRIYLNLDPEEVPEGDGPNLVGRFRKWPDREPGLTIFDATGLIRRTAEPGERISLTFVVDTPGAELAWERAELALFVREMGV